MIYKGEKYHVSERRTTLVVESSSKVTVYVRKEGEKRGRRPNGGHTGFVGSDLRI